MEYSAYKIPTIASRVYPYYKDILGIKTIQQGKTGFLARTTDDWIKYLTLLIENKDLRKKIGENAYEDIKKNWQMKDHYQLYEDLFDKIICNTTTQPIKTE
jgi:glycosyltransferase involved in cell wall biosynthesis